MFGSFGSSKKIQREVKGIYCAISGDEPSSVALLNRQRKPDYCAAISRKCTRSNSYCFMFLLFYVLVFKIFVLLASYVCYHIFS